MAALSSSAPSISLPAHASVAPPRRCGNSPVTAASALHRRCPTGLTTTPSGLNGAFRTRRATRNNPVTTTSVLQWRCLIGLTMNSSGMNNTGFSIKGATRISAVDPESPGPAPPSADPDPAPPSKGNFQLIPGIPPWAQKFAGAIIFAAPLYTQFRIMEDKVEQTAEVAIEVIDKVAEETEKIADEVAGTLPGDGALKKAALRIKKVAKEIEKDADKAEALIEKVDEIKKDIDSFVDPLLKRTAKK